MSDLEKKDNECISGIPWEFDVAVIGSGLAGLAAAIAAKKGACEKVVCVFEKNARSGKKFLLSGSGQCNITHAGDVREFFSRYGAHERFVQPALLEYPNSALIELLVNDGIQLEELDNGKIFPVSRKGADILACFERFCDDAGVRIFSNRTVDDLGRSADGRFEIIVGSHRHIAKRVVVSTGGLSMPRTGSTGDGFGWAKRLGHTVTPLHPALTPVFIAGWQYADCAGISFHSPRIALIRDGKEINSASGEILLTHEGLSGPAIMNMSRWIRPGDQIELALTAFASPNEFDDAMMQRMDASPTKDIASIVHDCGVPMRLVRAIFRENDIPENETGAQLTKAARKNIVALITSWPCLVRSPGGFDRAMVTAGGINLSEINRKTMESRIVPGLYFAGEVLDIDGDTGGFNLQFAWSSGSLAGRSAVS